MQRAELESQTPERLVTLVDTGKTAREVFEASMVDDQRGMMATAFEVIILLPGQRGPKRLDPERVVMHWTPDEPEE